MKLDADEKELLDSVDHGEWKPAGGGKRERTRYARYAKGHGVLLEVIMNAPAVHWDILKQDLRYTARTLNRARGFALTWSPRLA